MLFPIQQEEKQSEQLFKKARPLMLSSSLSELRCEAFSDADSVQAFLLKSEESAGGVIRWGFCSAVMKLFAVMSLDIF